MSLKSLIIIFFCFATRSIHAEELVAELSKDEVAITTNFNGSDIFIYGAVKRDSAIKPADKSDGPLEIVITVSGPLEKLQVRKKAKKTVIWMNSKTLEVDAAPSFYAVAATGNVADIISETEDLRHRISIKKAIRSVGNPGTVQDVDQFIDALIRIRQEQNLYHDLSNSVSLKDETLFATDVTLPANLVEGQYQIRIFLIRGGSIIDYFSTEVSINKVGIERFIYDLAHKSPLIYGLLSIFIAISAGWGASAAFRYVRL